VNFGVAITHAQIQNSTGLPNTWSSMMQSHTPKEKNSKISWEVKFGDGTTSTQIQNSPELHDKWSSMIHTIGCQQKIVRQRRLQTALSLLWSKAIFIYRAGWCRDRDLKLYSGGVWSQSWLSNLLSRGFSLFSSAPPGLFRDSTSIIPWSLIANESIIHQPSYHRRYAVCDTNIVIK
jgi:hypothetical protein